MRVSRTKSSLIVRLLTMSIATLALLANQMYQCMAFSTCRTHQVHSLKSHAVNRNSPIISFVNNVGISSDSMLRVASSSSTAAELVSTSLISRSNHWGNIAILSFAASFAQLLGRTTSVGRLLGAPVTAMAVTFVLSSLSVFPSMIHNSHWVTLIPSGGSPASTFLQTTSLTFATPLLLLGTSIRGKALKKCGSLLGSFIVASFGTVIGAILAIVIPPLSSLPLLGHASLPNGDGIKIASALLAKNIGGGINYMAVCSCLGASPESIAAGLCVDNVMALAYFPLTSILASKWKDLDDEDALVDKYMHQTESDEEISAVESLSHAFTIATVLTAVGQFLNSNLGLLKLNPKLNLSLPITTLLTVIFSTYYPPNWFLSPTSTKSNGRRGKNNISSSNNIARSGERLGTTFLYLFFATAGAPGWKLKDSIQKSFPSIATFLMIMYGVHLSVLWSFQKVVNMLQKQNDESQSSILNKIAAPQRLLAASSAAIGGPATAAALAQANKWESLLAPSLLVGNVGYAVATFIALIYYSAFR